jgi:hypothetical protein
MKKQATAAPPSAPGGEDVRSRINRLTGVWIPDCKDFRRDAEGKVKFSQAMLAALGEICSSRQLAETIARTRAPSYAIFREILPAIETYEQAWLDGKGEERPAAGRKAGAAST